jgi:HK97 gp10 family phage protein
MKIEFLNSQEVQGDLSKLESALNGPALLVDAASRGAKAIKDEAYRLVPRKTGNLARSLAVRPVSTADKRVAVSVGSNLDYALFVEYGTRRSKAQPYLRPAAETKQPETSSTIKEILRRPFNEFGK